MALIPFLRKAFVSLSPQVSGQALSFAMLSTAQERKVDQTSHFCIGTSIVFLGHDAHPLWEQEAKHRV